MDEAYRPAYVEDLDIGYRAWQRGWPSIYCAKAVVEHRHRATTSRYYSQAQLDVILEENYLRFIVRAVSNRAVFLRLWKQALTRLKLTADRESSRIALGRAGAIARGGGPARKSEFSEEAFLALTNGKVANFPGRDSSAPARVIGVERLAEPAAELLAGCRELVEVAAAKESAEYLAALEWASRR
jgi:hypothetical protein